MFSRLRNNPRVKRFGQGDTCLSCWLVAPAHGAALIHRAQNKPFFVIITFPGVCHPGPLVSGIDSALPLIPFLPLLSLTFLKGQGGASLLMKTYRNTFCLVISIANDHLGSSLGA